jgi:hypothetical protein
VQESPEGEDEDRCVSFGRLIAKWEWKNHANKEISLLCSAWFLILYRGFMDFATVQLHVLNYSLAQYLF